MISGIETRPYGSTGEQVTVVGLGCGNLGGVSLNDGVATVHCALDLGIEYFDTSPLYGPSQTILGVAMQGRPENYVLATKIGHFRESHHFRSTEALHVQIRENLRVLRRDYVDVLQVHEADWAAWWSNDLSDTENLDPQQRYDFANSAVTQVLQEAKEAGLCRFTGLTGNSTTETAHALRYMEVDAYLVAGHYDLLTRDLRCESLPLAREKGVAMVLGGALRGGTLVDTKSALQASSSSAIRFGVERLSELQHESGISLIEMGIRYLIGDLNIATILIGAKRPAEVEGIVAAVQAGPLPADLHQAIEELGIT